MGIFFGAKKPVEDLKKEESLTQKVIKDIQLAIHEIEQQKSATNHLHDIMINIRNDSNTIKGVTNSLAAETKNNVGLKGITGEDLKFSKMLSEKAMFALNDVSIIQMRKTGPNQISHVKQELTEMLKFAMHLGNTEVRIGRLLR